MKYIKTKDGVYKEEIEWTSNPPKQLAIKIADTIEELCDEFVIINPDIYEKPTLCYGDYDEYKDELHKEDILFGAIWTDKGLIYVAKMNEKGELELLWLVNNYATSIFQTFFIILLTRDT